MERIYIDSLYGLLESRDTCRPIFDHYCQLLDFAVEQLGISKEEARERYGHYTYAQWADVVKCDPPQVDMSGRIHPTRKYRNLTHEDVEILTVKGVTFFSEIILPSGKDIADIDRMVGKAIYEITRGFGKPQRITAEELISLTSRETWLRNTAMHALEGLINTVSKPGEWEITTSSPDSPNFLYYGTDN